MFVLFFYNYAIKPLNYWKKKKVPYEKALPLFGSILPLILRKKSSTELFSQLYKKYANERYFGMHNFRAPILIVRDPDLIKTIFVKEFQTFPEHKAFIPKGVDRLWNKNLYAMEGGDNWQDLRSTLSPTFTSSKMKTMFGVMNECSQQFSKHYLNKGDFVEIDLKDAYTKFANDVIAATVFGVTIDSLSNSDNEFYRYAKEFTNFGGRKGILLLLNTFIPIITKLIKVPIFTSERGQYFTKLVKDAVQVRREKGIVRLDMLQLLMEAQTGQLKFEENASIPETGFAAVEESELGKNQRKGKIQFTDELMTAQALIFFFAGLDSVSTMLSFAGYELAVNPDIQEKLRNEIDDVLKISNGEFTYDNVANMKYLDMVLSETLRKWPPYIVTDRHCVRPFTIEPQKPDDPVLELEAGSFITCPIQAIHSDPKYYPNPEKFDPERFNEENKRNIQPYTYLPFGVGPRSCIASRFALLEGKIILAEMISKFEIVTVNKTQMPMVLSRRNFNPLPDNGFWVGLKTRAK